MKDELKQTCFQIHIKDNVATLLNDAEKDVGIITGESKEEKIVFNEEIKRGHKVALKDIDIDEFIIKYNVVIGKATKHIKKGDWVHLHNCASLYDARSSTLNLETGAPSDTEYI
ncbi:UxaA family hydrolase [Maledivibacter halophilus]|uniref:Altronate dehydratase small subunit n=1 Tax=Maledivibacter halophilus TaxID=36842 RepID=A0A1T5M824_9FIRM|nr:UxaA family hydrolase [Maledivibacter halophilus]SKC84396.1 altronate dehydratase small subunit [Maledivibacter halophilus]